VILPTDDQTAEVMEPGEEAFDFPAAAVAPQGTAVLGFPPAVVAMRRDHPNPVFAPQGAVEPVAVIGRIADHPLWLGSREAPLDRVFDEFRFMRRSAGDAAGDRKTMAVCDRHDFAAFAAASGADSRAPFFAALKLASMNVSDRSILPRSRRSSAKRQSTRVSVPSRCHC